MVKFATALCVLLVAYGAQGSSLSSAIENAATTASSTNISALASSVESAVHSTASGTSSSSTFSVIAASSTSGISTFAKEVESTFGQIEEEFKFVLTIAEDMESTANKTITAAISQMSALVANYSSSSVDVSSCYSLATDFESVANQVIENSTLCVGTYVSEMDAKFNTTVGQMSVFLEDLYDMAETANSCSTDDISTWISCMAESVANMTTTTANEFNTLMTNASTLIESMSTSETQMEACGLSSAITELQSKLETYTAMYAECAIMLGASAA